MDLVSKSRHIPDWLSLLSIADDAGAAILRHYGQRAQITQKADTSPLTAADLESHEILTRALARLIPGIPIISEEGDLTAHASLDDWWWLIDPLDGTKEFIHGNGQFTVNIALMNGAHPIAGVVTAPAIGVGYCGGVGLGAWKRVGDALLPISVAARQSPCRVVASRSHLNDETRSFIASLGETTLVQSGSSLKFCLVAEGTADVYPRLAPTHEWDTAAAQAVVEGAGGAVLQPNGTRLTYGRAPFLNPHFIVYGSGWIHAH
ncbi:MAG: 3'(2'),5'-bisphosphate nucleotidase CysQ [Planctomycetota bacterium]|nr:3'(2'),5'-bisphosphate nucleotidase CysQ [Planctomycetota bacterium]